VPHGFGGAEVEYQDHLSAKRLRQVPCGPPEHVCADLDTRLDAAGNLAIAYTRPLTMRWCASATSSRGLHRLRAALGAVAEKCAGRLPDHPHLRASSWRRSRITTRSARHGQAVVPGTSSWTMSRHRLRALRARTRARGLRLGAAPGPAIYSPVSDDGCFATPTTAGEQSNARRHARQEHSGKARQERRQ